MKTQEAWNELTGGGVSVEPWFKAFYEGRLFPWWMVSGATPEDGKNWAEK